MSTSLWTLEEQKKILLFKEPYDIQLFLDRIPYNPVGECRSPRKVLADEKAHCFEGALFAAAMLRELGYKPLIVDMAAENDDDHVIAVFRQDNFWGSIAKSNTTALRYREPVYRTLRELIMSYFDFYFNTLGEKSLRSYSRPVNLARFDRTGWATSADDLEFIGDYLYGIPHIPIVEAAQIRQLKKAEPFLMDAVFMGADEEGLFKAKE
jgi:hypothetical protein